MGRLGRRVNNSLSFHKVLVFFMDSAELTGMRYR